MKIASLPVKTRTLNFYTFILKFAWICSCNQMTLGWVLIIVVTVVLHSPWWMASYEYLEALRRHHQFPSVFTYVYSRWIRQCWSFPWVDQWIERPPGLWKVMGSIPVGVPYLFFFVQRSCHVDQSSFTELKIHHLYSLIKHIFWPNTHFYRSLLKELGHLVLGISFIFR